MKSNSEDIRLSRFKQYQYCLDEEAIQSTRNVSCDRYLIGKGNTHPSELTDSEMEGLKRHITRDRQKLGLRFSMESSQRKYLESLIYQDKQDIEKELQVFNAWKAGE